MVQELTTLPSAGTRFAQGFNQGMSNVLPKEFEHQRLKSGLQTLAQQAKSGNLSPEEFLANAAGTYGISPQAVQSFGQLAKQRAQGRSLSPGESVKEPYNNPFKTEERTASAKPAQTPSVTKAEHLDILQKGFTPPTKEEEYKFAGDEFNKNPNKFNNDPAEALKYAQDHFQRQQERFNAVEKQNQRLTNIQDNLVTRLQDHSGKLQAQVPANLYSAIEDKAINAVRPKDEGGEGLSEQDAMKKYGKELDIASRDYGTLKSLGNIGLIGQSSDKTLRSLKNLQQDAKKRGDTENMADTMIAENGTSPMFSYSIFEPVSDIPKLNKELKTIPALSGADIEMGTAFGKKIQKEKTLEIAKKLTPLLKESEGASPLAIGYELKKKGYDPDTWLEYITNNRKDLNLKENQVRQLEKPEAFFPRLNDWWLSSFSGIE